MRKDQLDIKFRLIFLVLNREVQAAKITLFLEEAKLFYTNDRTYSSLG